MPKKTILLDFDGTFTITEKEAEPCLIHWHQLYSEKTGMPMSYLINEIEKTRLEILSDPKSGWSNNGFIVAQATADPYVLNTTIYQSLMKKFSGDDRFNIPKTQELRDKLLYEIFVESYAHSDIVFRPGAKIFLDTLMEQYDVAIVTNSKTDAVEKKLKTIVDYPVQVIGNAKKYVIDNTLTEIPESVGLCDFPRPVLLRRRNYKEILEKYYPKTTVVIGDIYELDLALPEYLGFKIIQLATDNTPKYEIIHHQSLTNNLYAKDYDEIIRKINNF